MLSTTLQPYLSLFVKEPRRFFTCRKIFLALYAYYADSSNQDPLRGDYGKHKWNELTQIPAYLLRYPYIPYIYKPDVSTINSLDTHAP